MKNTIRGCTLCLLALLLLTGCQARREKAYYADKDNYITDTATVENVLYEEETESLYFWLSDIREEYSDTTFVVRGESVSLLLKKGDPKEELPGCVITYVSAPEYFGDGYCMPLVSLSVAGEEWLAFEEGYENLLKLYE